MTRSNETYETVKDVVAAGAQRCSVCGFEWLTLGIHECARCRNLVLAEANVTLARANAELRRQTADLADCGGDQGSIWE
jgi:hypothetical protein